MQRQVAKDNGCGSPHLNNCLLWTAPRWMEATSASDAGGTLSFSMTKQATDQETPRAVAALSRQERLACEEECNRMLCDTIAMLARYNGSMDAMYYERLDCRDELAVYKRTGDANDSAADVMRLVGTGYIHGKLDDITSGLYCETDDALVGGEAVLSCAPVVDGAVLQLYEQRGAETPFRFAGVKWLATPTGDVLTYERMGVTLDSDNTEVAYHVQYAIPDRAEWPQLAQLRHSSGNANRKRMAPVGLKRLEPFAVCYVYRKVTEDLVLCFIVGEYWGKASARSQRDVERVLADRILMVANAVVCHEAKKLTRMVEDCQETPVQMSKTCLRCRSTRRTVTDPLRVCGICRKSVCSDCRVAKQLCRLDDHTRHAETETFCLKCLSRVDISLTSTGPSSGAMVGDGDGSYGAHQAQYERRRAGTVDSPDVVPQQPRKVPRRKQYVDKPMPMHSYNYDDLLRKRGSGGSATSSTASSMSSSGGPVMDRQTKHATSSSSHPQQAECTVVLASVQLMEKMKITNDDDGCRKGDLYLTGANGVSGEAERQYQRYLNRHKSLDLESIRGPPRRQKKQQSLPSLVPSSASSSQAAPAVVRPVVEYRKVQQQRQDEASQPKQKISREAASSPSPVVSAGKKATKRDFYRDLYTEL